MPRFLAFCHPFVPDSAHMFAFSPVWGLFRRAEPPYVRMRPCLMSILLWIFLGENPLSLAWAAGIVVLRLHVGTSPPILVSMNAGVCVRASVWIFCRQKSLSLAQGV